MVWFLNNKMAVADDKLAPEGYAGPFITMELWTKYNMSELGIDYDIIDNQFVQLHTPEYVNAKLTAQDRIIELKEYLNSTDYVVTKYMEGVMSEEDYLPIKQKRIDARAEINKLQEIYSL